MRGADPAGVELFTCGVVDRYIDIMFVGRGMFFHTFLNCTSRMVDASLLHRRCYLLCSRVFLPMSEVTEGARIWRSIRT